MHIESVTIENFRCFGPEPTVVTLGPDITALIGVNGAGKTAFIEALRRLFGVTREERTLTRADVHFGRDERTGGRQSTADCDRCRLRLSGTGQRRRRGFANRA
jgi:putative ATP-dependent endonuclease of OLD family